MRIPALRPSFPVFLFFLFCHAGLQAQKAAGQIKIAVTTDIHGAFFPADWFSGEPLPGSLAQVSTWIKDQRKVPGQEVILLDNGDLIHGDPASYYSNYLDTTGKNVAARILNHMGYEAATVGNHDIEAGHSVYDKLAGEFRFPYMAANAVRTSDGKPYFAPYTVIRRAGIKIAVLGLVTPRIPEWLPQVLWTGMKFNDMVETARYWMNRIIREENPDLVIGLFHSGADPDYGQQTAGTSLNENASRMVAEQVSGFDVIFTGHDHRHWNFKVAAPDGDSTLVLGSGNRAVEIAVADIRIEGRRLKAEGRREGGRVKDEGRRGLVEQSYEAPRAIKNKMMITGGHVEMGDIKPDQEYIKLFSGYIDTVQRFVDQPVGILTRSISTEESFFGPSAFTDLIHRVQLEITGADLSFAAPLSFRANLPAGELTVKDLFRLYRYENQLYTMKLTGEEILRYLNYSYSLWMNRMTGPNDAMINMAQEPGGSWRLSRPSYNFDSAAGIDYTVDVSQPPGRMVAILQMSDGKPYELDRFYTVAVNSYRGSGGGGHLGEAGLTTEIRNERLASSTGKDFRLILADWIRKQKTVEPAAGTNWKVIPEDWIRIAAPRDKARLFGN